MNLCANPHATPCHVMHRARALSTKMNNDRADGHCYSFDWKKIIRCLLDTCILLFRCSVQNSILEYFHSPGFVCTPSRPNHTFLDMVSHPGTAKACFQFLFFFCISIFSLLSFSKTCFLAYYLSLLHLILSNSIEPPGDISRKQHP